MYSLKRVVKNQFIRISKVFVEVARNKKMSFSSTKAIEEEAQGTISQQGSPKFKEGKYLSSNTFYTFSTKWGRKRSP